MLRSAIAIGIAISLLGCSTSVPEGSTSQPVATPIQTVEETDLASEQAQEQTFGDRSLSATRLDQYSEAVAKAQSLRSLGQENPILPWEYRRGRRNSEATVPGPAAPVPS